MTRTISSNITTGITLDSTYNPLYIDPGITVSNTSGYAIKGTSASAYTITNAGTVRSAMVAGGGGIYLKGGGTLTNQTNAYVYGFGIGVDFQQLSTISNYGTIKAGTSGQGIYLPRGGTINNTSNGMIIGGYNAIKAGYNVQHQKATITNYGTIAGRIVMGVTGDLVSNANSGVITGRAGSYGILLRGTVENAGKITGGSGGIQEVGGYVSNASMATISGGYGVFMGTYGGTLVNAGTITGTATGGSGVEMFGTGQITNSTNATISNSVGIGVYLRNAATLLNQGVITGSPFAVYVRPGHSGQLQLVPGQSLNGKVDGGNAIGSSVQSSIVLESGSSTGVLNGLGPMVYNFASITFAPAANWFVGGNTSGIAGGETFTSFALGDTLDIGGVTNEFVTTFNSNTLVLGGTEVLDVIIPGAFTPASFVVQNDQSGGTSINLACFAEGTRIRTSSGEVPVEKLLTGMKAMTRDGSPADIVWIGHRAVDCRRHTDPARVHPVRVRAGAFGPGMPSRDLRLSPDHAVFVEGVLIPVRYLINDDTIRQEAVDSITYYHVELPRHDVILAEGLPVESYLDIGDRQNFANGQALVRLFPDFSSRGLDPRALWEAHGCSALVVTGPKLDAARRRIAAIAATARVAPTARLAMTDAA